MRASRIILRPAAARTRVPSISWSRLTTRTTRPSIPRSAIRRFVPAPSSRYGIPRCLHPSIVLSIASARASSRKKSAGPPMPNDVREASGSFSLTPASSRSQARLDLVRQVIAQLPDIARAHQQDQIIRTDDLLERFLRLCEVTDIDAVRDLVRKIRREDAGHVLLTRAVNVEHKDPVGADERTREVVHQRVEPRVAVRLEDDHEATVPQLASRLDRGPHLGRMMCVVVVDRRT